MGNEKEVAVYFILSGYLGRVLLLLPNNEKCCRW